MSLAVELAQVWVPVMPETSKLSGGVNKIAGDVEKRFGRTGKVMGSQMLSGVDSAKRKIVDSLRDIERAQVQAAKATKADADAAGRLELANKKLEQVNRSVKSTDLQRATAAEGVARAQRAQELTATNLTKVTKQLSSAQRAQEKAQDALKGGGKLPLGAKSAGRGGLSAGAEFVEGFTSKIGVLGKVGGPIGMVLMAAAGAGLAAGAVMGRQVMAGMETELKRDVIGAKMGADPATMKRVGAAAQASYLAAFGDSIEDNMETVRAAMESGLIPRDAATGVMTSTINDLQTVASILGEDVPQAARGAGQMIKTKMVASVQEAADVLVWGQQNGLNVNGDLVDSVNEYSTQFRKLGFDARTSLAYVSQMVKGGARDTDVASDALKEFSIRVVDGSKGTTDAMTTIGLNADAMAEKFAAGGPSAKDAFAEVVTAINAIEDPVKRTKVQVGLFGTQAEDLGDALNAIDPARVATEIDQMSGASKRAADTMGDNAATSIESAKRTFEVGLDNMQTGLAGTFSPMLSKAAQAFSQHTPEIIGLFTNVAAAALDASNGIGAFASGSVRVLGFMLKAFNASFTPMIDGFSSLTLMAAKAAKFIPGMQDDAEALTAIGEGGKKLADGLRAAPDALEDVADGIDDVRRGLPDAAENLRLTGKRAQDAAVFTRDLGDAATKLALVDGKLVITDNTPEVLANIDETQYAITHLPDGTVELVPKTAEATRAMQAWRDQEEGKPIDVPTTADTSGAQSAIEQWKSYIAGQAPVGVPVTPKPTTAGDVIMPGYQTPPRATGGIFDVWSSVASFAGGKLPKQAMIQQPVGGAGLVQWAEPSTAGEAFIPLGAANRTRSLKIWGETGRRLGVMGFDRGGIRSGPQSVEDVAAALSGVPYVRGGHSPSGLDCSGAASALINAALGLPPYGDRMATANAAEWLAARGAVLGEGPPGTLRVGWKNGGPGGGHMAVTLPDGRNAESGGSVGKFTVGAGAAGAGDFPNQAYIPMEAMYPDGWPSGGGGGYGGGAGGGGRGGSGGGSGGGVWAAQSAVASAEGDVREKEAKLAEVKADAKSSESDKIAAENDLAKAERDRDKARADLTEAQNNPGGSKSGAGGPDTAGLGQGLLKGAMEGLGLDGETFSDPTQWGIFKLGTGLANMFGGVAKNWNWQGIENAQKRGGMPLGMAGSNGVGDGITTSSDGGLGGVDFGGGGAPMGFDALQSVLPQTGDLLANSQQPGTSLFSPPVGFNDLGSSLSAAGDTIAPLYGRDVKPAGGGTTTTNSNNKNSRDANFFGSVTMVNPVPAQTKAPRIQSYMSGALGRI